jgi:hypothetical protein
MKGGCVPEGRPQAAPLDVAKGSDQPLQLANRIRRGNRFLERRAIEPSRVGDRIAEGTTGGDCHVVSPGRSGERRTMR